MIKDLLKSSLTKYIIVGLTAAGFDYILLLSLYRITDLPLAVSTTVGFLGGLFLSFVFNKYWAFSTDHGLKESTRQVVLTGILVVFNLLITNMVVIQLNKISVPPEVSKVLTLGIITSWNYLLFKNVIFRQR